MRFLISLAVLFVASFASAQNVVHYTTTNTNVKYLFATAEPVAPAKKNAKKRGRGKAGKHAPVAAKTHPRAPKRAKRKRR